jgi:hypothetical protein
MPDESKENHGTSHKYCWSPGQYCNSEPPEHEEGLLITQVQGPVWESGTSTEDLRGDTLKDILLALCQLCRSNEYISGRNTQCPVTFLQQFYQF